MQSARRANFLAGPVTAERLACLYHRGPAAEPGSTETAAVPSKQRNAQTDGQLLDLARAGDYQAFEVLADRHAPHLYRLAHRIVGRPEDAEDVLQCALLKALENLENFRGEASFGTWLRRIAMNIALNQLRKRRGLPMAAPLVEPGEDGETWRGPEHIVDWRADVDKQVQRREVRRHLEQAIEELEDKHRLVFILRDVEGLSVKETAEELGISASNVKVRLMRARLKLRDRLSDWFGEGPELKHEHDFSPRSPSTAPSQSKEQRDGL